jgi:Protein of unknown function (DUF3551)
VGKVGPSFDRIKLAWRHALDICAGWRWNSLPRRVFDQAGETGRNSMIMTRTALILVAVATLAGLTDLRSAGAEIYRPWCVQYGGNNGDNGTTCAFTSFEQCMMTARGSGGFCVQNPWYLQYGGSQKGPESTGQGGRSKRR